MRTGECMIPFDTAPFRFSGAVYGVLLNHSTALHEIASKAALPPYNGLPRAPVLYIKPRNTLAVSGSAVQIPAGCEELETGACLGLVIGRPACNLSVRNALDHVAGYLIVNDVSIPHEVFYPIVVSLRGLFSRGKHLPIQLSGQFNIGPVRVSTTTLVAMLLLYRMPTLLSFQKESFKLLVARLFFENIFLTDHSMPV